MAIAFHDQMQFQAWDLTGAQYTQTPAYSQQALVTQEAIWVPTTPAFAPVQVQYQAVSAVSPLGDFSIQECALFPSHREGASPMRQRQGPSFAGMYSGPTTYLPHPNRRSASPMRQNGTPMRTRNPSPFSVRHPSPSLGRPEDVASEIHNSRDNAPRLLKQQAAFLSLPREDKEGCSNQQRQSFTNHTLSRSELTAHQKERLAQEGANSFIQNASIFDSSEQEHELKAPANQLSSRSSSIAYHVDKDKEMPLSQRRNGVYSDSYFAQLDQERQSREEQMSFSNAEASNKQRYESRNTDRQHASDKIVYRQIVKEVPVEIVKEVVVVKEIVKEIPVEKIVIQEVIKEVQVVKEIIREIPLEKVIIKYVKPDKELDIEGIKNIFCEMKDVMAEVFSEIHFLQEMFKIQEYPKVQKNVGDKNLFKSSQSAMSSIFSVPESGSGHVQQRFSSLNALRDVSGPFSEQSPATRKGTRDLDQPRPVLERWKPERERASIEHHDKPSDSTTPPRLTGLGMRLERREGSRVIIVEEIIPGFAADMCRNISVGDVVENIDGHDVTGWSLDMLKNITVGPVGSVCCVRIMRDGKLYDMELTRAVPQKISEGTSQQEAHAVFEKNLHSR